MTLVANAQRSEAFALSPGQLANWEEDGYIVLQQAAPRALVEAAVAAVWANLEMRPDIPADWYDPVLRSRSGIDARGIVPMYHHQALWDCRQWPSIHRLFAQLWGREDLLVSIDRVNMNPPVTETWPYRGFIHWDIDVAERPIGLQVQGLLALSDAPADGGSFQCVAGFHREIEAWLDLQGPGYRTRFPDVSAMEVRSIPLRAGDLLVWRGALPHGNSPNRSRAPRLAQYLTMTPSDRFDRAALAERIECFLDGSAPRSPNGKPLPPQRKADCQAALSSLGRRLLGMDPW